MKISQLLRGFLESEKAGGIILLLATSISLLLANSLFGPSYIAFWESPIGHHSLTHWINDGLMTIFFLLIGLELEREIYHGELSKPKEALLPILAATGGMLVPAALFLSFNIGTEYASGAGIPMATDIAFALGVLSLLGNRVPLALKIFLTALAVIDDLGAVLVIAIFYTNNLNLAFLGGALGIFGALLILNRLKVHQIWPYLLGGLAMWFCMLQSGVHATLSGILLAFALPFGNGDKTTASYRLQHFLHKPVAYLILPIFALANTAFAINGSLALILSNSLGLGIMLGLVFGKPIGVFVFSWIAIRLNWCKLPDGLTLSHLLGAGFLAGIGFTMSIFIALLAFQSPGTIMNAKIAVLMASVLAAIWGLLFLQTLLKKRLNKAEAEGEVVS